MVDYRPKRDNFVVNGAVLSPGRVERLSKEIDAALERREVYKSCDDLDDELATTEKAIDLICGGKEGDENIPIKIGFVFKDDCDSTTDDVPEEYIEAWIDDWGNHGSVLVWEPDVKAFFEETDGEFSGFQVEFADHTVRHEYLTD